ncbi:hypothetical protein GQX73_g1813 [Xylaria multiplex]|uniref:F-box domain-containing protein n=1 Tax=Xylaria multiplex TaxID=323545 RepID=A0A7C8ITA8_9PEZI|nr:hypothetical protein GQX73_g1813 [Xylaria multiplex]
MTCSDYSQSETFQMTAPGRCSKKPAVSRPDSAFLEAKCLRFKHLRVSECAFVLMHPKAEKLVLEDCVWDHLAFSALPNAKQKRVHTIHLIGSSVSCFAFEDIFTKFPGLRELNFFPPPDEFDTMYDMVGEVFVQFGQALESLTFFNEHGLPFTSPLGSLKGLTNLKSLEIDLEFLIGFRTIPDSDCDEYLDSPFAADEDFDFDEERDSFPDWSFLELLPASLEKLIIWLDEPKIAVYFDTYERYGAKLEELLTADRFDKLEYVQAPLVGTVVKKLGGKLTGWAVDTCNRIKRVSTTTPSTDETPRVVDIGDGPMTDYEEDA